MKNSSQKQSDSIELNFSLIVFSEEWKISTLISPEQQIIFSSKISNLKECYSNLFTFKYSRGLTCLYPEHTIFQFVTFSSKIASCIYDQFLFMKWE